MNLIRKLFFALFILIGLAFMTFGFSITVEEFPNPTSNHWFDCMLVIIGVTISITGLRHIKEK